MAGPEDLIPGKELEKAAADVATDAGKSLIRGIARTLGAGTAEWTAKKEARADAARKEIETQAELRRANALTDARRSAELSEIEHSAKLELAKRRAERMVLEMAREQENLEAITKESLLLIEDQSENKARDIDEEWLFRFAELAEKVSDKDVQKIWARALQSASIEGKQKLSAAALLQLSLVDAAAAKDFEKVCRVYTTFGFFAAHEKFYERNALGLNVRALEELDLIKYAQPTLLQLSDFSIEIGKPFSPLQLNMFHAAFVFTQRGADIANAIFKVEDLKLSDEDQDLYLQDIISTMLSGYDSIMLKPRDGLSFLVVHAKKDAVEGVSSDALQSLILGGNLSQRLIRLAEWASQKYVVTIHQVPS